MATAKKHCRVEVDDDDDLISGLIVAARRYAEVFQRRALLTSTWEYSLDSFPIYLNSSIRLPIPPVQSITSVKYVNSAGSLVELDSWFYVVDTASQPARIFPVYGQPWPVVNYYRPNQVVVEFVAGYEPEDVPQSTKQAMLMLIAAWYAQREAFSDVTLVPVPMAVEALLTADSWGGQIV